MGTSYVNSVQHGSITISSGSASNTYTLPSAVGSLAFIIFLGNETDTTARPSYGYARVELTNSNTVTAYRQDGLLNSATAKFCVVDATSDLVSSVQSGTVTIAASSTTGTGAISAVTATNTALHFLGHTSTATSEAFNHTEAVLSYSGTTVTATRISSSSDSVTVGYEFIEFNGSALNSSVQSYQVNWTNSSNSTTQTITSVTTNNTILICAGQSGNSTSSAANVKQRADLTNSTTVTIQTNSASSLAQHFNFYVVEFATGVLNSAVQRGTTTVNNGSLSATSTLGTAVTTSQAMMNFVGNTGNQSTSGPNNMLTDVVLTDGSTVTTARGHANNSVTSSWEVVEFVTSAPPPPSRVFDFMGYFL